MARVLSSVFAVRAGLACMQHAYS